MGNHRGSTENHDFDFSYLTDGLESEREQGITIDVAYRYFSTKKNKFIIADCPGHKQYTRNMITGASTADCIILLLDITKIKNGKHIILMQHIWMQRVPEGLYRGGWGRRSGRSRTAPWPSAA